MNKGSKIILSRMKKKKIWGEAKGIQRQTLKNHFCKDVDKFEECLDFLENDELLEVTPKSLRLRKRELDPTRRKRAK